MRSGIGITTYNRKDILRKTLQGIFATSKPDVVVVSDDGSTDGTEELVKEFPNVVWLFNKNGGIARNKNRLIFRLFAIERCADIVLIEDDVIPIDNGWFLRWIYQTRGWGHINLRFDWMEGLIGGKGTFPDPYISSELTGQVIGISRRAWQSCGYMDPRFKQYGYEHVEYSRRLAKRALGGSYKDGKYEFICFSENDFEFDHTVKSNYTEEKVSEAFEVLKLTVDDEGYKDGWTNQSEFVLECLEKD